MLIPNMRFVLTKTLIVTNEIAEYWPKSAILSDPERAGLDFGHAHIIIFK
jgi:hypothetical protein